MSENVITAAEDTPLAEIAAILERNRVNRVPTMRGNGRYRSAIVFIRVLRFTEDALKGNTKTAAFLFNRYAGTQAGESQPSDDISEDDREVLDAFVQRFEAQLRHKRERP